MLVPLGSFARRRKRWRSLLAGCYVLVKVALNGLVEGMLSRLSTWE